MSRLKLFIINILVLPNNIAIGILFVYRKVVSPLYGSVCKYHPTCSKYAVNAYQHKDIFTATFMVGWRILRCNPWTLGGIDEINPNPHRKITKQGFISLR